MPGTALFPPPQRRFLPEGCHAADILRLEQLFESLLQRDLALPAAIERLLNDQSEVLALVSAEGARRYIAMTCNTEDPSLKERYLWFEREVTPRVKTWQDRLDRALLAAGGRSGLGPRYAVLLRARECLAGIFREENNALEAQAAELSARYGGIMGAMTVEFRGEERTLQQLSLFLEDTDRTLRESAWRAAADRRARDRVTITEVFDQLLVLRHRIAQNAGCPSYVDYRFRELCRFDYTPADCFAFHRAVEAHVIPALAELDERRRNTLGLGTLRPWDLDVDLTGAAPVRPFRSEPELIALARRLFTAVDPRFAAEFAVLEERGMLDLMSRKGKRPGGYQYTLEDVRLPFIFANSAGKHDDVQTLLHEGGHAFHALLSRDEPLLQYREVPLEFAEVASMGMELLALEHLDQVYPDQDARIARRGHFEGILRILPWIASVDAFQHWLYHHPQHTHAERTATWLGIRRRFAPTVDWSGLEDHLSHAWQAQPHLFGHPLYYIEYGIAQIGALQVWRNYRRDPAAAVRRYREALTLGGSRPLPELFATAGLRFGMDAAILEELIAELRATQVWA
jgi:oligoendopeptidase F